MQKFSQYKRIVHVMGFAIAFIVILCVLDYITGKNVYNNRVWEKVQDPSTNIDILIMGNSHAYTSIDAKALSACLDKEIDVLGSGAQNMEEAVAALQIVIAYEKPQVIMLDAYAACVDSKGDLQSEKKGLLYNNLDGVNNYILKCRGVLETFKWNNFLDGTFQLFRPNYTWEFAASRERIDTHGYAGRNTYAMGSANISDYVQATRQIYDKDESGNLTEYNIEKLHRFLDITEENGISVILCSNPTCTPFISKDIKQAFSLASGYENVICMEDMGLQMEDIGLEINDFYDDGHLNRRGAVKNTEYISDLLAEACGLKKDWDKVFSYKSEKCDDLGNGTYAYTMENFSPDCLYQFRLFVDGEIIERQDYSRNNTFVTNSNIAECGNNVDLLCYMIPMSEAELGDASTSRIGIKFMKPNDCYIK